MNLLPNHLAYRYCGMGGVGLILLLDVLAYRGCGWVWTGLSSVEYVEWTIFKHVPF